MAEFSQLIITKKGQALVAKMLSGIQGVKFTRIAASDAVYKLTDLEKMETLGNVRQSADVAKVTRTSEVTVTVETAFTNTDLIAGYFMRVLGLYAVDPDDGEILYAVAIETSGNCYMPLYAGVTVSGAYIQLVTSVGNATNVSLEVSNSANATIGDINELRKKIDALVPRVDAVEKQMTGIDEQVVKNTGQLGFLKYLGGKVLSSRFSSDLFHKNLMGYNTEYIDVAEVTGEEMKRQFNLYMDNDFSAGFYSFDYFMYSIETLPSIFYLKRHKTPSGKLRDIFGSVEFRIYSSNFSRDIVVPIITSYCSTDLNNEVIGMNYSVSVDISGVSQGGFIYSGIKVKMMNHLYERLDGVIKPLLNEEINFLWLANINIHYIGVHKSRKWPSGSF